MHPIGDYPTNQIGALLQKPRKAKQFGSEHGYKVDPTQEAVASSMSNIFGSFFFIMPTSCSLSRSSLQVTNDKVATEIPIFLRILQMEKHN